PDAESGRGAQPGCAVQLWNTRTGAPIGKPLEHPGLVRTVAFSNDGRHLIVGAAHGDDFRHGETSQVHVWNVAERVHVAESISLAGRIKACAVAGDSGLFAISVFEYAPGVNDRINVSDGKVILWQLHADGRIETHGDPLRPHHVVWSMQFSPDGRMLLAGCENSGAYLWSVANGQQLLPTIWHDGNVTNVAFRKDGRQVVPASAGGAYSASARLWDVPRFGHIGRPLPQRSGIRGASWDEDNQTVWICTGDHQTRWDPIKGTRLADLPLPEFTYHINNARDGKRFFLNFGHSQLHVLDRTTGAVKLLDGPPNFPRGGDFYRHDIASKKFLRCWNQPARFQFLDEQLKPVTQEVRMPTYTLGAIAYSSESNTLVATRSILMRANEIVIYNADDLSIRHTIPLSNAAGAIAFSRDGKTLAFGGLDRQVQRIDVVTGKPIGTPLLQEQVVAWIAFLNNDRCLATSSEKGQILLWDLPTGKRIGPAFEHNGGLNATEINCAGKRLLACSHGRMAMTWRFPEEVLGSVEQVRTWVETLTELEMTQTSAFVQIEGAALQERRGRIEN
ncbi:MAG TPA: WD40 repeat domain-containing protein, partial [Gemmataceae bacterium]|nr:WD40 repeat domain-containing protein [Gemmataceae bacterium]